MSPLLIVTGASRGFGRALSIAFATKLSNAGVSLTCVLLARDEVGLAETRAQILSSVPDANVTLVVGDLSDVNGFDSIWTRVIESSVGGFPFTRAILINNAGSTGPIGAVHELGKNAVGVSALRTSLDLNIVFPLLFTAAFLRFCASPAFVPVPIDGTPPHVIVNVSSLAGVVPFSTMGVYSLGKAARDMFHNVIGIEHNTTAVTSAASAATATTTTTTTTGRVMVKTLSYAPGPMDTILQSETRADAHLDLATSAFFNEMEAKGTWVNIDTSARLCARIVAEDDFVSGAHIDYYDRAQ